MGILDKLSQRLAEIVDDFTAPDAQRELLAQGNAALQAGDFVGAEERLRQLVTEDPTAGRGWQLLGLSQLRQGGARLAEALGSLEHARDLRPDSFDLLLTLAEAQRAAGLADAAVQTYKQALGRRVDERLLDQVFGGLGEIYLARGDTDHAVRELRKAVAASGGADLRLLGLLGQAQHRAGAFDLARHTLARAASAVPADHGVLLTLTELLLTLGQPDEARLAALRLRQEQPDDATARCALARCHLALGQLAEAHDELLQALRIDARRQEAHELLGQLHARAGDESAALRHLRVALDLAPPGSAAAVELLRQILALALEEEGGHGASSSHGASSTLRADAEALLALCPDDPLAIACRAISALADADADAALHRSLALRDSFAARLGLGLLQLGRGLPDRAAVDLRAALRLDPGSRRAAALLAHAYALLAGVEGAAATADLYPLLARVHTLLLSHPLLGDLAGEAARIQHVFDRPLLITVMGEFNSGKSTFVNALIGEQVAPMGITPTTATINVLKYGERRGARVVWRDDHEQMLSWEEVPAFLATLQRDRARDIRLVELLYPAEELLRVNVVDTPGLNSLIDEHEQTARQYMGQSDAVVWLFSAHQAGKQTEEQALELIHQHRLKTVGVINKIDRLRPGELEQLTAHLRQSFAGLIDAVVPVSARAALDAIVGGQSEALEASRFPALRRFLEEQLFAQSRAIKREACGRRLAALLGAAEARVAGTLEQADRVLAELDEALAQLPAHLPAEIVPRERRTLQAALQAVYRGGASEVLDFVRPRRWAFGEHRASRADRDFLLELLQDGLRRMGDASFARVAAELRGAADQLQQRLASARRAAPALQLRLEGTPQLLGERLTLLQQQVYTRHFAYARGLMRGGRIDSFFERLPRLELAVQPIYDALFEGAVDLEEELLAPLARWYDDVRDTLRSQLRGARHEVELQRLELEARLSAPLLALQRTVATAGASGR